MTNYYIYDMLNWGTCDVKRLETNLNDTNFKVSDIVERIEQDKWDINSHYIALYELQMEKVLEGLALTEQQKEELNEVHLNYRDTSYVSGIDFGTVEEMTKQIIEKYIK